MSMPGTEAFVTQIAKTLLPHVFDYGQAFECARVLSNAVAAEGVRKISPRTMCGRVEFDGDIAVSMHVLSKGKQFGRSVPTSRILRRGSPIPDQEREAFNTLAAPRWEEMQESHSQWLDDRFGDDLGTVNFGWITTSGDDHVAMWSKVHRHGILASKCMLSTGEITHEWEPHAQGN